MKNTKLTVFVIFKNLEYMTKMVIYICPFNDCLIECDIELYISGYVKTIYDDIPSREGGIPCKDMGPIDKWWVNTQVIVILSTEIGDYILNEFYKKVRSIYESYRWME